MILTKSLAIFNILKITNTVFIYMVPLVLFFFYCYFGLNKKTFLQTAQNSKIFYVFFTDIIRLSIWVAG
jgi:hypothetical protein